MNQSAQESIENKDSKNLITAQPKVSRAVSIVMAQMGSKGGKIGGKRRLLTMTAEARSQIASDAAKARWAKSAKS